MSKHAIIRIDCGFPIVNCALICRDPRMHSTNEK